MAESIPTQTVNKRLHPRETLEGASWAPAPDGIIKKLKVAAGLKMLK